MSTAAGINWSFSKLMMYETCAFRWKLKYIERMPEPPLPPDNPMERGNRIHNHNERYIKSEVSTLDGNEARQITKFKPVLDRLQELHACGMATAEEDIFFNVDWELTDRQSVWLWLKKDFSVVDEANSRTITGDWKSGKSAYKAVEHVQQLQLYAACDALEYPDFDEHVVELHYVDEGHVKQATYAHEQALRFVGRFQQRVDRLYADRMFRPNPNKVTCKWCPYSPRGTGACPVGV